MFRHFSRQLDDQSKFIGGVCYDKEEDLQDAKMMEGNCRSLYHTIFPSIKDAKE